MILGIDIGLTGAIGALDDQGTPIEVIDLPTCSSGGTTRHVTRMVDGGTIALWLERRCQESTLVYVEAQAPRPGQGVAGMFSLGHSYGIVCGVLAGMQIPFLTVHPQAWKKDLGLLKLDKDAVRERAIAEFPQLASSLRRKKDHGRAEALWIAYYGWKRQ